MLFTLFFIAMSNLVLEWLLCVAFVVILLDLKWLVLLQNNKVCFWSQEPVAEGNNKSDLEDELLLREPELLCEAHHPGDVADLCVSWKFIECM